MKKLLVLLSIVAALLAATAAQGSGSGSIVVGEIFAAGGNSGASFTNDYVVLFNRGSSSVALSGWTLQYASATGTAWASTSARAWCNSLLCDAGRISVVPGSDLSGSALRLVWKTHAPGGVHQSPSHERNVRNLAR